MALREQQLTLRFLATPSDKGYSGNVDGGRVMEWVDKAGYALAAAWSGCYSVTAYVGNVQSAGPVRVGHLVEVVAQLVHTGRSSMHIEVVVRSADPREGTQVDTVRCLVIFVAMTAAGQTTAVPVFTPGNDVEVSAQESAIRRIALRASIEKLMSEQTYSDSGTAPRVVLRFLAAPTDVNWGGNVHGGIVMRWIDEAAHVVATQWSGNIRNVAVYSGGIRFYRPLVIGDLVEIDARLLHTGNSSMHISVHVRSGDPRVAQLRTTTHSLTVFVAVGDDDRAAPIRTWVPVNDEDRALDVHAVELVGLRDGVDRIQV